MRALIALVCAAALTACADTPQAKSTDAATTPQGVNIAKASTVCTQRWTDKKAALTALSRSGFTAVAPASVPKARLMSASLIAQEPILFLGKAKTDKLREELAQIKPDGSPTPSPLYVPEKNVFVKRVEYDQWFGQGPSGVFLLAHWRYFETHLFEQSMLTCVFLSPGPFDDPKTRATLNGFQKKAKFVRTAEQPYGTALYSVTDFSASGDLKSDHTEIHFVDITGKSSSRLPKNWQPDVFSLFISSNTTTRKDR